MKWRLPLVATGALAVLAATGLAIAQGDWTTVDKKDVEICRPVFAEVHRMEQDFLQDQIDGFCAQGTAGYDEELCGVARDVLDATQQFDDVDWYMLGNETCGNGSPYPCYGPSLYNSSRTGRDAQLAISMFRDDAAKDAKLSPEMSFRDAAVIGDRCIAKAWIAKHDGVGASPAPGVASSNGKPSLGKNSGGRPAAGRPAAPAAPPASAVPQADVDACIDGTASLDSCASLLAGIQPSDPSFVDLALALVSGEIDAGRPDLAIHYGDMIADQRSGLSAALVRCTVRVTAKWDLDAGLAACNAADTQDPGVISLRGEIHLMAARWADAWNDFDSAYRSDLSMQTLFLRGLASAGQGKMADAVKDTGMAEQEEPGTTESFEEMGYTLTAVLSGKPLVPPEAFAPLGAAPSPAAPAAPTAPGRTPAKPAGKPSAGPVAVIKFAPDAPRGQIAPLSAADSSACEALLSAAQADSQTWKGTPEEIALRLGLLQRTLFAGRCAGHGQATGLVAEAERNIAASAASAASAFTDANETSPDAINCVEPMAPNNPLNPTGSPALRNSCNFPVNVAYCNVSPAKGSWAETFACGSRTVMGMDVIPANGATPAVFGLEIQHFACRQPAAPVLTYQAGKGLDGFCK
ncbi:MAG: hypothetical protein R3C46_02880 [Hyphomonadaceae bacterium]